MSAIGVEDVLLPSAQGRLYARRWSPADAPARAPLVLFHDSLGSVELWRDFPERLAQATGRAVIAYDRLGFGRSDAFPGALPRSFVLDEACGGFRALRERLGLGDFVALGHSVGGGMAAVVAGTYPESCRALITESAQAYVEERTREGIRAAQRAFAEPGQLERLARYHGDKARWVLDAWIETWLSPEFRVWRLDQELRHVRCPLLALHGGHDEYGSTDHPQRIAAAVAGPSTVRIFEHCGHIPHRESPQGVLEVIAGWLATTDP